ncbi:homing endonuclease [Pseudoalteromonas phage pYD6-A]|uniref:DUF559 domain-containing protein n=1 Tax=Pseudoalteromonas phage pYD6-A TaxID=754052 RepID=M4SS13_9CAUD|nr:homing endonuclease [Pseudoalteromonas phage pYD6-A]AGH57596.1 hypothetical protein PYDG_00066 [Pseudoalteromonas phage pYD6-A]
MAKKISKGEFQKRLDDEAPLKYTIVDYTSAKGVGTVIHNDCGTKIYQKSISNLLRIKNCPTCHPGNHKDTKESLELKLSNWGIKILGNYVNERSPILIQYPCGCKVEKPVDNLKQGVGVRCLKCNSRIVNHVINIDEANVKLASAIYGKFSVSGAYNGMSVKTNISCNDCGHIHYNVSPNQIIGRVGGCEVCGGNVNSVRERFLKQCLHDLHIRYECEKDIEGYRIDVYVPDLNLAIEYDGEFHDISRKQQDNDTKKDKLLTEKGINLLRIHHSESILLVLLPYLKNNTLTCND